MASGLACLTLASALAAIGSSFAMLAAGRLLYRVGFVFCSIYYTKMVADWFAGRELATAMAILVVSWPLGIAMGQVGHAWLATALGWQAAFAAAALYCLTGTIAMLVAIVARMDADPACRRVLGDLQRGLRALSRLRAARCWSRAGSALSRRPPPSASRAG